MADDLENGRGRTDLCKAQLLALIEKWAADGADSSDVTAALVEAAADASLMFLGPDKARDMFEHITQSLAVLSAPKGRG
ncbi:hypothetical protein MCP1_10270 [Candidatus Terasakiella magnetica]|nr:hypothetical protein MCP1_10270 [Candidatus Terasakiella magnetica]